MKVRTLHQLTHFLSFHAADMEVVAVVAGVRMPIEFAMLPAVRELMNQSGQLELEVHHPGYKVVVLGPGDELDVDWVDLAPDPSAETGGPPTKPDES